MSGYRPYPAYKPCGIDWLGDVPEGWESIPLKHLASVNDEVLPEATPEDYWLYYVDISGVDSTKGIVQVQEMFFKDAPSRARRLVRHGDVIVSTVRTYLKAIARVENPDPNLVVSTGFAVLRPRSGLDSRFAGYLCRSGYFIDEVISRSVGVSYPAINALELVNIKVPVPRLDEQRDIATFLDRETSRIDAAIDRYERLIALLGEKRQALISHVVTKGLDPDTPMKHSGMKWLGEIPVHWEVTQVRRLARDGDKSFTDGDWIETPYITDEGFRLIQTGNIGVGAYKEQGFRFISAETFEMLGCTPVEPNDVLICRLADPVGRACLAPSLTPRQITSVDVCILKTRADVDERFVVYFLSSKGYLSYLEVSKSRGYQG